MKGIVHKEIPIYKQYYKVSAYKEYEILGIDHGNFYIIDDNNNFTDIRHDIIRIIDDEIPHFWKTEPNDNSRMVPNEWLYENFLFLNEGLEDFANDEIWIKTQFLKGLKNNYAIKDIPRNLISSNDVQAKEQIVNSILRTLTDYSNQFRNNSSPYLDCNFEDFKFTYNAGKSGIYENEGELDFTDKMIVNEKSSFENLKYLLNSILEFPKIEKHENEEIDNKILNRIVYSIWSVFETDEIQIIERKYKHYFPEYILKTNEKCYKLSIFLDN